MTSSQPAKSNLNPPEQQEPGFMFGPITTPQLQTGASALPTTVAQVGVTFQDQQPVVASTDVVSAIVPENVPPQPTVPTPQIVPTPSSLLTCHWMGEYLTVQKF